MADDDVLAGVPDDVIADDDAMAMEAAEEAAADQDAEARERAAARARQLAAEQEEDEREAARERRERAEADDEAEMMAEEEAEGAGGKQPKKVGKRRIIHHALDPSLLTGGGGGGAVPVDEEEMERRRARAAKFEMPLPEPPAPPAPPVAPAQMLTMAEIQEREERAKKWGVEPAAMNPLDSLVTMAGDKGFWEKRRDASVFEAAREEAVHVFGTDRMSTEDLLLYFIEPGVTTQETAPQWVEWVNDSSANVVFASAEACAAAVNGRTVALLPSHTGIDPQSWRTMPPQLATAGKGLQLIFRIATVADIKPAKRAASRYYGEIDNPSKMRRLSGGVEKKRRSQATKFEHLYAKGRAAGKKSLAEAIAIGVAKEEQLPSLAQTIAMKQGPTLADMAAGANNAPTLADMAAAANDGTFAAGPTLADMASGRRVEVAGSSRGGDLRSRLGSKPKKQAAVAEPGGGGLTSGGGGLAPGGMFSYEAAKAEQVAPEVEGGEPMPME